MASRERSRSPGKGAGTLNSDDIAQTLCMFGRQPEKRPPGLLMDSFGAVLLSDLMETWGYAQGLWDRDVVDAVRRNMLVGNTLRFAITCDTAGKVIIRVNPAQRPSLGAPPPLPALADRDVGACQRRAERRPPPRQAEDASWAPRKCSLDLGVQSRFFTEKQGERFCILCNQYADAGHIQGKKHAKRVANPEWYLETAEERVATIPRALPVDGVIDLDADDNAVATASVSTFADSGGQLRKILDTQLREMTRDELIARVRELEALGPRRQATLSATLPPDPGRPPPPPPTDPNVRPPPPLQRKLDMALDAVIATETPVMPKDEDMVD